MGRGRDIDYDTKIKIFNLHKQGFSNYAISKKLDVSESTARRWGKNGEHEILKTGNFSSRRKGNVGRKNTYSPKSAKRLTKRLEVNGMTQRALAKKEGHHRSTIIRATRKTKTNPSGAYPYTPQKSPQQTPVTQKQLFEFSKRSPVGKAARKSRKFWDSEKLKWAYIDHSPFTWTGAVNKTHRPCWRTDETRDKEGIPAQEIDKKFQAKNQAFTAISYASRHIFLHTDLKRKKKKGKNVLPNYKMVQNKISVPDIVHVIENYFGPHFKSEGIEVVFSDNDKKLQSKGAVDAWAKFGIKLWHGAGKVWNNNVGGFPVNFPKYNPLDQSVHHTWKNVEGGFYYQWNKQRKSRRTPGAFIRLAKKSWYDMKQQHIQHAMDKQREFLRDAYSQYK